MISLESVSKKYNGKVLLDHVCQSFDAGRAVAFMGHNGCGKSTLLKIIAGLVKPTSGRVTSDRRVLFHYVPEKFMPVPLTARAYLRRMGALDGLGQKETASRIDTLANDFFFSELLDVPTKYLSKGSLQKVSVIQALLTVPDALLLDEPLSGQDAASQEVFIRKINALRDQGVTVFMACHEQRLVDAIAEKTFVIRNGRLETMQIQHRNNHILILENAANRPIVAGMERFGSGYRLRVVSEKTRAVLLELLGNGWELRGMYDEKND